MQDTCAMRNRVSNLIISRARTCHLREIAAIEKNLFSKGDSFSERRFQYLLSSRNSGFFVCLEGQRCIGYGIALRNKLRNGTVKGRIYSLAVVRGARGRGVGSLLLNRMEEWLTKRGVSFITLEARKNNKRAINIYKARGYRATSDLQQYYGAGTGMRMMKKV
jgi:ribosomal-protein-alanine N-acetyltransferase